MSNTSLLTCLAVALLHWTAADPVSAESRPYEGGRFQGRIAYSRDGNHNDPDDWAASPVTLAILAEAGLKERLVHFDYNCILPSTDSEWEKTHAQSVLGAAERYGFDKERPGNRPAMAAAGRAKRFATWRSNAATKSGWTSGAMTEKPAGSTMCSSATGAKDRRAKAVPGIHLRIEVGRAARVILVAG